MGLLLPASTFQPTFYKIVDLNNTIFPNLNDRLSHLTKPPTHIDFIRSNNDNDDDANPKFVTPNAKNKLRIPTPTRGRGRPKSNQLLFSGL